MISCDQHLKLHVVCEITCSGRNSTYIGKSCVPIITRIEEHQKSDLPVRQRINECSGTSRAFDWRIIDQSSVPQELLTRSNTYSTTEDIAELSHLVQKQRVYNKILVKSGRVTVAQKLH